ncbi:MAG: TIGR01244 family phosphatase [Sphingomonadaceae bacterium]|nr:TIGR01244 family phosphatase [Sphingomonadaceae bacterium]
MFVPLTDTVAVAGQLAPADLAVAAAAGYTTVVNNRPDGEEPGQPAGADMRAAAEAAGLGYAAIPIGHAGLGMAEVAAMVAVLDRAGGPVLAFCRSGTRSANLWALAEAHRGGETETIITACARGRYDVSGLRPVLMRLAAGHGGASA